MSGWHGGKGHDPRPLSITPEEFGKKFDAIDWNAREREAAGCPLCGSTAVHACTGHPPREWTEDEKRRCVEAMDEVRRREAEL